MISKSWAKTQLAGRRPDTDRKAQAWMLAAAKDAGPLAAAFSDARMLRRTKLVRTAPRRLREHAKPGAKII
ncbi:hypothetical protein THIARS_60004 [Thiomonas delicata]|uniref:Uncharacterized protein n=1 Tax=Thiomonas delicata TaxID=364030 RepID=A0A238D207_THIDL|nr:hypothetical protein THIARS_60004 [Thiomonas delicata]